MDVSPGMRVRLKGAPERRTFAVAGVWTDGEGVEWVRVCNTAWGRVWHTTVRREEVEAVKSRNAKEA
ncbi:MAG: hypothetical protein D6775_16160 [Caldilineae bacterium]|nr:MAG: hypothetical protein D6775_16160 [Caldilineae bacterium]